VRVFLNFTAETTSYYLLEIIMYYAWQS
jgi:hypothetical protein